MYIWKDHTKSLTDVFGTSNNGWFFLGFHCIFPLFYALVPKYDYGFTPWITLYSQCIAYYLRVCVCVRARACAQLCLTLRPHGLVGLPGSSISGIIQARILEWVAISSSRGSSWPRMGPTSRVSCIDRCVLYHWATWEAHRTTWHSVILHKCIFDYMKEYKLSQNQEGKTNSILLNFKRPR